MVYTPASIYTKDIVSISSCIVDDSITKVEYYVEDVIIKTVVGSDQSSATFDYVIDNYKSNYIVKQKIFFFNGIEEVFVWYSKLIPIQNAAPVVTLISTNTDCTYRYTATITDFEDETTQCKFDIQYLTPMDLSYKTIYTGSYSDSLILDVTYNHPGKYKVICYGKDASGNVSNNFIELETACGCSGGGDCPDTEIQYVYVANYDIQLNTQSTSIDINMDSTDVMISIETTDVTLEQNDIIGLINGSNTDIRID